LPDCEKGETCIRACTSDPNCPVDSTDLFYMFGPEERGSSSPTTLIFRIGAYLKPNSEVFLIVDRIWNQAILMDGLEIEIIEDYNLDDKLIFFKSKGVVIVRGEYPAVGSESRQITQLEKCHTVLGKNTQWQKVSYNIQAPMYQHIVHSIGGLLVRV